MWEAQLDAVPGSPEGDRSEGDREGRRFEGDRDGQRFEGHRAEVPRIAPMVFLRFVVFP